MRIVILFIIAVLCSPFAESQTISWASYPSPAGQSLPYTYNTGTAPYNMSVVVSKNNTTQGDGTPKYTAIDPSSPCYTPQSLALYTNPFSSVQSSQNAHYNVNMRFNPSANGSCIQTSFTIKDINSEESWATFLDVIEITAVDGNGTAIPAANIVIVAAPNTTVVTSGTMKKIVGHNNSSEAPGSYFSSPCNTTTVTITPPATVPLQSVNIKYRPAYGTSTSNSYYNIWPRPATQYISISNLSYTTTAGCTPMPVELMSYATECSPEGAVLKWATASEQNNAYFTIEKSNDGVHYMVVGKVEGKGTNNQESEYAFVDENYDKGKGCYYRLSQTDFDGTEKMLGDRYVNCSVVKEEMRVFPNPATDQIVAGFYVPEDADVGISFSDYTGKQISYYNEKIVQGQNFLTLDVSRFSTGMYILTIESDNMIFRQKFLKE
jgi:hypothetical protein